MTIASLLSVCRGLRKNAVDDLLELCVRVGRYVDPFHRVPVVRSEIQDFGLEGDPSFVWQLDRNLRTPAYRFLVEALDEATAGSDLAECGRRAAGFTGSAAMGASVLMSSAMGVSASLRLLRAAR